MNFFHFLFLSGLPKCGPKRLCEDDPREMKILQKDAKNHERAS